MTPVEKDPSAGMNGAVAAVLRAELAVRPRAQRLTYKQLSEISGVSLPSMQRYLAAGRHIDVATLDAICEALELDPAWVIQQAAERLANHHRPPSRPADQAGQVTLADAERAFAAGVDLSFVDDHKIPDLTDPEAVEAWLDAPPAGVSEEQLQRVRAEADLVEAKVADFIEEQAQAAGADTDDENSAEPGSSA